MKRALFLIIGLLVLSSSAQADEVTLSGYAEVGKRSTAEDYEEEDTDDDYTYQNYHLKLKQDLSDQLSYDVSSFIYDKDYKSRDSLDNISRIFKTKWSYYIKKIKEESLKIDFRLKYKEKRYDNTPASEYDQIVVAPTVSFVKRDSYSINVSTGIDNFDYLEKGVKDQLNILGKIEGDRYFLEKSLLFTSSYEIKQLDGKKADRDKTKQDIIGGFDYVFDLPWVYKITTRASWGERDTKEVDERDEDYDYEYWYYYTKTQHRINPKFKTDFKYQYFKKDYITADLDHRGFYIRNGWDYEILDDEKNRLDFELLAEYKDVEYNLKTGNDYNKETAEIKATYEKKKRWKMSTSLEANFYNYNKSTNDKKRYYALVSGERLFLDGDLGLSIDFKYRYTDYEQNVDKELEAVRLTFKYKF